ncbi:hypothetical protein BO78DRAFT_395199 [Aspergillus sclerotiicarbonarius CBS 121057]|uniref:Calcineurin-like phosphoesterase domain-containing protein n=1 Tax=Aspergillus sclerotiicarbonarius (strain CBS 121057 / IBT 28362) TaxID=1448318 RepID=A0A319EMK6_ASPSB|nr:hypothetical protein BO78DRAFT_395199 [Aspergillus sclerotiicarbonarius CBS 121057]
MMDTQPIKTRFLIISDTHGMTIPPQYLTHANIDVLIHCGDLTTESKLAEYHQVIQLLQSIPAPLKLLIAGNHDFTLDDGIYTKKMHEAERTGIDIQLIHQEYGQVGEARALLTSFSSSVGITFLDEGTHHFKLSNGATLNVYASPYTPSAGDWGFQYRQDQGHDFSAMQKEGEEAAIDVVITHGPPHGIMDYLDSGQRAGCPQLFETVARCRPKMHCFGHIHEGWGGKLVAWRKKASEKPSHFTDIDHGRSEVVAKLTTLGHEMENDRNRVCYATSHCAGDPSPIQRGLQTLFVNAAIEGTEERPIQLPWLVDLDLPGAKESI